MVQRATDAETAQEVLVAEELARYGASAALIERLTGFGARWVRRTVKRNGGALACKPQDPMRWFQKHPERLLHGRGAVLAYERQPVNRSPGRRLLDAYLTYRKIAPQPGLLDVNKCAEITQLYQSHNAWIRTCRECRMEHLVLSERPYCPVCMMLDRQLCRGCKTVLPVGGNPARAYCDECTSRTSRREHKPAARRPESPSRILNTPNAALLNLRRPVGEQPLELSSS